MSRHVLSTAALALAGLGALFTVAAQAQTDATAVDCESFLAMTDGQRNAVAAVVETALDAPAPVSEADLQVLVDAGVDPAAAVPVPPPAPGETARVLAEACAGAEGGSVMEALSGAAPAAAAASTDG